MKSMYIRENIQKIYSDAEKRIQQLGTNMNQITSSKPPANEVAGR